VSTEQRAIGYCFHQTHKTPPPDKTHRSKISGRQWMKKSAHVAPTMIPTEAADILSKAACHHVNVNDLNIFMP